MSQVKLTAASDPELPEAKAVFQEFKERVAAEGLLKGDANTVGDDVVTGIEDDGALGRFIRGHAYNIESAFTQYKATRAWRDKNRLIELYDSMDVKDYDETRKMYTHWTGRRDRKGVPVCWFEVAQLTPKVMEAYATSCALAKERPWKTTESEAMLRLFCTYENMMRFVMPFCSAVKSRPNPERPITDTTCIVDIGGVGLMQFWRLKGHMSAASNLATANYPETLGKTFVIGAPSFFPTIWGWLGRWFNQNTMSKICIIPSGQELAMLSETIHPDNIPKKYGGNQEFEFGMPPHLDQELKGLVSWEDDEKKDLPLGPIVWTRTADGKKEMVAVGTDGDTKRKERIAILV